MNITHIDKFNSSKISLNRQILNWEWYTDVKTFKLFIHCLLRANFKDNKFRGLLIKRGQFITSLDTLVVETGLTKQEVRTALKHLISTGEISKNSASGYYSIITVVSYNEYQNNEKLTQVLTHQNSCESKAEATPLTQVLTLHQHTSNTPLTLNNNDNNEYIVEEEQKNENLKNSNFYGEYFNVFLTDKQYKELEVLVMSKKKLKEIIDDFSVNIETGKEAKFETNLPNAHFERVKAYFKYRRKNPNKFREEQESDKKEYWNNDEYTPY